MNNDPAVLYHQMLAINEDAFANNLFDVSYHALSGAYYCAVAMSDEEKCAQVEQLVADQQEYVKVYFAKDGDSHDGYREEPIEIVLYRALHHTTSTR